MMSKGRLQSVLFSSSSSSSSFYALSIFVVLFFVFRFLKVEQICLSVRFTEWNINPDHLDIIVAAITAPGYFGDSDRRRAESDYISTATRLSFLLNYRLTLSTRWPLPSSLLVVLVPPGPR
jgi:hypothetical protein